MLLTIPVQTKHSLLTISCYTYLNADSFCSSGNLNTVFPLIGLTILITEAHIPFPALGEPKISSGKFSLRKLAAISAASCFSSSPAASTISYKDISGCNLVFPEYINLHNAVPKKNYVQYAVKGTRQCYPNIVILTSHLNKTTIFSYLYCPRSYLS